MQMTWREKVLRLEWQNEFARGILIRHDARMLRTPMGFADDRAKQLRAEVLLEAREILTEVIAENDQSIRELQEIGAATEGRAA